MDNPETQETLNKTQYEDKQNKSHNTEKKTKMMSYTDFTTKIGGTQV